ncbi:MAG: lipoyl(octanoyl) transferase LipB, partial [Acidimicrobiales bacterium]
MTGPGGRVGGPLRVRWLGRVEFRDAHALQRALHGRSAGDHLLLLEHPSVYTMGRRATLDHVLVPPESLGADLVWTDRGGDVTWHGPGQLVGYPIVSVPVRPRAIPGYVAAVEQVVIDALADLGLPGAGRQPGRPGVWVGDGKICAIGVRLTRGRSMHGFALNVDPDLSRFDAIVPCGLHGRGVTSLAAEGVHVAMRDVVDAVVARAAAEWGRHGVERQGVAWRAAEPDVSLLSSSSGAGEGAGPAEGVAVRLRGRLAEAGVDPTAGVGLGERKPAWVRAPVRMGPEFRSLQAGLRERELVTVCEEAGCPNIFECWSAGTATFMINGSRCTRACGFCLVDTRRPGALDPGEPERVASAVEAMGLE